MSEFIGSSFPLARVGCSALFTLQRWPRSLDKIFRRGLEQRPTHGAATE